MSNFITLAFKKSIVNGGFIRAVDHINSVSIVIKDLRTHLQWKRGIGRGNFSKHLWRSTIKSYPLGIWCWQVVSIQPRCTVIFI